MRYAFDRASSHVVSFPWSQHKLSARTRLSLQVRLPNSFPAGTLRLTGAMDSPLEAPEQWIWWPSSRRGSCFVLGPCVIESEELTLHVAREVANRQCGGSPSYSGIIRQSKPDFRGVLSWSWMKQGLAILKDVRQKTGLPIIRTFTLQTRRPWLGSSM
jgi:hypothetical protein